MSESPQNESGMELYLEDLQVGQRFVSRSFLVDEQQIIAFARRFDPQPFHVSVEAAKNSFFGELVASGWHTAAITMQLMVDHGIPIAGGLIGAGAEISWPKPTRPGSVLHVESEVLEIKTSRSRPDRGIATVRSETRDQNGDVLQVLTAKMIVFRRPTEAPAPGSAPI